MNSKAYILFIDDDEEDHLIMFEYFKDLGKEKQIKFTRNGHEALGNLSQVPEGEPLPRLIVIDLNMPVLNGKETLYQLKSNRRFKDIPVVIFSTSENEHEKHKCYSLGAKEYLVKPTTYADGLIIAEKFVKYLEG